MQIHLIYDGTVYIVDSTLQYCITIQDTTSTQSNTYKERAGHKFCIVFRKVQGA